MTIEPNLDRGRLGYCRETIWQEWGEAHDHRGWVTRTEGEVPPLRNLPGFLVAVQALLEAGRWDLASWVRVNRIGHAQFKRPAIGPGPGRGVRSLDLEDRVLVVRAFRCQARAVGTRIECLNWVHPLDEGPVFPLHDPDEDCPECA